MTIVLNHGAARFAKWILDLLLLVYYSGVRFLIIFFLLLPISLIAQRQAVLKQIDVPHSYYYREMYLPQFTSGPSSACWTSEGKALVYSMQGSLWIQQLNSGPAIQLTAGPGYDYQPDCSRDGKKVVFARYNNDAIELHWLNLQSRKVNQITTGGAVNVDPRWSPDGSKIIYVSTSHNGRFHLFVAHMNGAEPKIEQLTKERRSKISRYYYSPFDHELSPTWSPDGAEIIFISNPERLYGTGGFWRMKAEQDAEPREIHYEETTWKAHPDWSPDGKRVIYSSYLGRQWHQLWVMTDEGGDPFPLTYGEFDITAARWSPDGKQIAYVSNESGNTSLWLMDVSAGGKQTKIEIRERTYLNPTGKLEITVHDPAGKPVPARVTVTGPDGRFYVPDDSWAHADDGFDRSKRKFEAQYFHTHGRSNVTVPAGKAIVEIMRGPEYRFVRQEIQVSSDQTVPVKISLQEHRLPDKFGQWFSGDLHVHMNYGGAYRNTPSNLLKQAEAENLNVVNNLIVNKEQRIPDISYFSTKPDPVSTAQNLILHAQEFHTSYWGHLGLLNLKSHYLIPDYSAYVNTGAASLFPTNAAIADITHEQNGLVGYVHPWDWDPDPAKEERLTNELPIDVALGKVDYYEVVGFSDHHATAHVWYRLLNCGFRISAGAGTDAMSNYASLRGPLGTNRVYVKMDGDLNVDRWMAGLKAGRTFATNGPLVGFQVEGRSPGDEIKLPAGAHELKFDAALRSVVPMDHLEIVFNGNVIKSIDVTGDRMAADQSGTIKIDRSGWIVLRAWNKDETYPILDLYPYASTNPIYINVGDTPVKSPEDAAYFVAWIDRVLQAAEKSESYNTASEKTETLNTIRKAREVFTNLK